ncbi:FAD-dependent oxidoreductase [Marinilactibacillus sp. GCM10026970]|uniref:FAD-dependent oxidoreductase n=1 Tax=Marinilactibacillus sp. GCM10026970 TaxID=3252642 RepID=UPI0036216504
MTFSAQTRKDNIDKLKQTKLDLLIIGGGITGAGLALQAGAREMKAGLVEMQDFAAGTSSRSTKLVHGGLRYLKQFDVELVSDVAQERAVIGKNVPHVVQPSYMLMPVYDEPGASFNEFSAEVVLHLYDYLAHVEDEWAHYMVEKEAVIEEESGLRTEGLLGGGYYLDYTNDDSRLTTEIIKKAHDLGTLITNYVKAIDFIYDDADKIVGIKAEDTLNGEVFEIHASVVVNAAGPWSDEVRKHSKFDTKKKLFPTKGVHFVVDHSRLPVGRTIYADTGMNDNRMMFFVPRSGKTYFGTTDTPFEGEYQEPDITQEDIDYLLEAVNYRFPDANITLDDIESSWAGLRPLIQDEDNSDPSGISRGHDVFVSEGGLVTVAGGKLTDYRRMANDTFETIDKEFQQLNQSFKQVDTADIRLSGGDLPDGMSFSDYADQQTSKGMEIGLKEDEARALVNWYGTNVEIVYGLKDQVTDSELPLKDALQLEYAIQYEMTLLPEDFLSRRTETLLFDVPRIKELKQPLVDHFAKQFNWTDEEKHKRAGEIDQRVSETTLSQFR